MDDNTLTKLLRYFESVYVERAVYRRIAQQVPQWKEQYDFLAADPAYRAEVSETFSTLRQHLDARQRVEGIFQRLDKSSIQ